MTGPGRTALNGPATTMVDFTRSIPPLLDIFQHRLASGLVALAGDSRLGEIAHLSLPGGSDRDRMAGACWLAPRVGRIDPARIMLTNGTQSALLLMLRAFVGHGGSVYTEVLSYAVIRELAERVGVRLAGVAIDHDGLVPEALEAMCRKQAPRALYLNPAYHNPTTSIMPEARRLAIADIARRHGFPILEDDTLGGLHPECARPIAALAPDVTWYVAGVTKSIAHGMRVAYLAGPSVKAVEELRAPVARGSHWFPAPLQAAILSRWIEDGTAAELRDAIRHESDAREQLARHSLGQFGIETKPGSMHIWLPLPDSIPRHDLVADLKCKGVLVRPAEMFAVDETPPPNAVRLSLSSPEARDDVACGLAIVRDTLERRLI